MSRFVQALRRLRDDPETRLAEAGVGAGMTVADVGAGYGYFSIPAATMVGEKGLVYSVEPDSERAKRIVQAAAEDEIKNVIVVTAPAERMSEIPSRTVDLTIAMSSVHHFADLDKALSEIRRIAKPGGAVYVRDLKAGRIFKHGSDSKRLKTTLDSLFPGTAFTEGSRHIVARIRIPADDPPSG